MRRHCFLWGTCCAVACLFFTTCGLDQFYLLEEPTVTRNLSHDSTEDYLKWYVDFDTNEDKNADYYSSKKNAFTFLGTEIYYKIYNSTTTLSSHRSSISSVNTSSNYSAAATRMIETYGYKPLGTYPAQNWTPFVECREKNQRVRIRLKSYGTTPSYEVAASIAFDGGYVGSVADGGIQQFFYDEDMETWHDSGGAVVSYDDIQFVMPYRNGNQYSFDFFNDADDTSSSTPNREPQEDDGDYQYTAGTTTEGYYVQLYAVAVGRDNNYTPSYSLVLDLGTIPIKKGE